jgi:hypothetical protein
MIESRQDFRAEVGMAEQVQTAGYWPSAYTVRWDENAKEYRIALTGLVNRN